MKPSVWGLSGIAILAATAAARAQTGHYHAHASSHSGGAAGASASSSSSGSGVSRVTINPGGRAIGGGYNGGPGGGYGGGYGGVIGGGFVYPPAYYGLGYYPFPPVVITPPPSTVWRTGPDGRIYSDLVTTPVLLGGGFYPSFPLQPISAAETAAASSWASPPPAVAANPAVVQQPPAAAPRAEGRARDSEQAEEKTTLGDRLFRGDRLSLAVKRYEQAIRADPDRAEPRARLAQVALVRGDYAAAANALREAEAAEPGWLLTAGDVQGLYREPGEFAAEVAKLEAHLQERPEDRDAWLVLGAMWYLSGRTQKAADVFLRLTDRQADPTLAAFLRASKAN